MPNDMTVIKNWLSAILELERPSDSGRDDAAVKRNIRVAYNRWSEYTGTELWNWGYYDEELMSFAQECIPSFGEVASDGLSELLYLFTLRQVPLKLDDYASRSVVEVGCGNGKGLNFLSRIVDAESMVGLDIAEGAIAYADASLSRPPKLRFVRGDAEALPYDDGEVDVILNVESAHNYPSPARFLAEVERVLKPGGYFSQVDIYTKKRFEETRLAKTSVPCLDWIVERDISDNVKAAVRRRLAPDSVFRRLGQGKVHNVPLSTKLVKELSFKESWGAGFAGVRDTPILEFLKPIMRSDKERLDFACYHLSVARKR